MEAKYQSSRTSPKIPGFEWQEAESKMDRDIFQDILTTGRSILAVAPDGSKNPGVTCDFAYSLGFYLNLAHPELLIMGISKDASGQLLNLLFAQVEAGEHYFEDQPLICDFGQGEKKLVPKFVPQERYENHLGYGCWFYRSLRWNTRPIAEHKFPVLQLFWPDAAGYYPWHPACDPQVRKMQTLEELREGRKQAPGK